jgi:tRNA A37 threonylcarbamoyladenosine synthetase subunit TsaC/SUA5/YrdC
VGVKIEKVDAANPDVKILERAAKLIARGEVIVCPTDTGYVFRQCAGLPGDQVFQLRAGLFQPIHCGGT